MTRSIEDGEGLGVAPAAPLCRPSGEAAEEASSAKPAAANADIYDRLRERAVAEHGALSRFYTEAADEIETLRMAAWHLAQMSFGCEEIECVYPKGENCICFGRLVTFYRGAAGHLNDKRRRASAMSVESPNE